MTATHEQNSTILTIPVLYFSGFAGSGLVFGFREAVADSLDLVTEHTGAKVGAIGPGSGFAGSGLVFGFWEAVADSLDLVTEHTGAKVGAIGPADQVAHAVRMGQPESRGQLPERHRRQLPRQPGGQIPAHRAAALPQEAICDDPIVLGQGRQGRGLRWLHPGALDVRPPERLPVALEGRRHDHGAAMQRFYANLLGRREGLSGAMPKAEAKAWLRGLTRSECCPGPPIRLSTKSICLYLSHNAG